MEKQHKLVSARKVGRGVLMVPMGSLNVLTEQLERKGIVYVVRYVWT